MVLLAGLLPMRRAIIAITIAPASPRLWSASAIRDRLPDTILPQALKISIPGIVNTFIGLFKDTTLVIIIGQFDLLGVMKSALSDPAWNGLSIETYVYAAIFYFIVCFFMSRYSLWLEAKLSK